MLSTVAESQPQAAYWIFVSGFKNKLSCFMRTVPDISNLLLPVKGTIPNRFIPAIMGVRICNEKERKLLSFYQFDIKDSQFQFFTNKLKSSTTTLGE